MDANNTACCIFGYSITEMLNSNISNLLLSSQVKGFNYTEVIELAGNTHVFSGLNKEGNIFPVTFSLTIDTENQGAEPLYFNIINISNEYLEADKNVVNEFRATYPASIDKKDNTQAVLKNVADIITIVSIDFKITFQSASIVTILGYTDTELVGENIFKYIHPDDHQIIKDEFVKGIAAGGISDLIEFRFLNKWGTYVFFEANGNNQLSNNAIKGIIISSRDISARKKIQNEAFLSRFTLNNIKGTILWNKPDGTFWDCNDYCYTMLGYTKQELKNLLVSDIDRFYNKELWELYWNDLRKEKHLTIESQFKKKDGTFIQVEINASYILYDGIELNCALVSDITERKKVEKALHASESQVRSVFNNTEIGFILFSSELKVVSFNQPASDYALLEHNKHLMVNAHYLSYVADDYKATAFLYAENTLRGEKIDFDIAGQNKQLEEKYYNIKFSPVFGVNNEVVGLLLAIEDISERKQTEKVLQISNERFELVTQATFDAIWDWDITKNYLFWGKGYKTLFGYEVNENINYLANSNTLIHPEDRERIFTSLNDTIKGEENNWIASYRYLKSNGDYAFVEDKAVVIRNSSGTAVRMIGAMQDITQQKQKEEQLKLYESVITNSTDSVLITEAYDFDKGHKIVFVNEAFTKMTGYKKEDVMGKTTHILYGPKTNNKSLERLAKALKKFEPCEIEMINYKKNGEEFWVNLALVPIGEKNGKYTHWVSIQRDTTERNKDAIEKETIFEIVKSINSSNNLEKSLSEVIEKICRYLNFPYGEVWSLNIDENKMLFRAEWHERKNYLLERSKSNLKSIVKGEDMQGVAWQNKERIYIKDLKNSLFTRIDGNDSLKLVSAMALPIYFNSEVVAVFNFFSDKPFTKDQLHTDLLNKLTSQIGTDIQKNRKELELNQFFNLSPDLLSISGGDGYFKKINPAFTKILGYSEKELLDKPFNEFLHPEDKRKPFFGLHNIMESNVTVYAENRFIAKNGEIKWLAWNSTPLVKEGLIFSATKDITEKMKMDEERKKLINELTNNNKELKQFSYITSHNMRAPLTNLLAILQLLDTSKINDEETLVLIDAMKQSTHNLNETLNDLIKILIIKENTNQNIVELSFANTLNVVTESIGSIIQKSAAIIDADFTKVATVKFNKGYLESIFLNLITNSIKYAHPDRKLFIKIETKRVDDFIEFSFEDNGLGFNQEKVKGKMFGLYQKFHTHHDSKGIGLYLVHSQITALEGTIEATGLEGIGAKFLIRFKA